MREFFEINFFFEMFLGRNKKNVPRKEQKNVPRKESKNVPRKESKNVPRKEHFFS